ncbi:hypothetical protein [Pelomonas cellulosilytica]|uniref:Uncharacterized protein n=1 Tax=Pelomonas cellulosilytica TaxID=2906762 RepID=A0ABS8Y015_9BURK|nr:hypothetical protein [Pelomonas sp. P8]MCE4556273.1 hypothetical protein [Pelomonas sp. P8]
MNSTPVKSVPPGSVVVVVISPDQRPQLVELSEEDQVATTLLLGGVAFTDTGTGDWQGFYDWLRNQEGQVLGVRQWVDDPNSLLLTGSFSGAEADSKHGVLMIYFGDERKFDEASSGDQCFGNNRLLRAGSKVAVTFSASYLA